MKRFESFKDFNIEKPFDHKEKMNLRRQTLQDIKDYFVEFEDRGDFVSVVKDTSPYCYRVTILSDYSIKNILNIKRIESKFEIISFNHLDPQKPSGLRDHLVMILRDKDTTKYVKQFEEWDGTIKVGRKEIEKFWNHSSKIPERFFNYIRREISPIECRLEGNTIKIGNPGTQLCVAEMSAGFNMVRTVKISEIDIWLNFGSGGYTSEDGYFNITIYTNTESIIYNTGFDKDYRFTSDTIEDLCEFLNKIFKEGVIDFKEPD